MADEKNMMPELTLTPDTAARAVPGSCSGG